MRHGRLIVVKFTTRGETIVGPFARIPYITSPYEAHGIAAHDVIHEPTGWYIARQIPSVEEAHNIGHRIWDGMSWWQRLALRLPSTRVSRALCGRRYRAMRDWGFSP